MYYNVVCEKRLEFRPSSSPCLTRHPQYKIRMFGAKTRRLQAANSKHGCSLIVGITKQSYRLNMIINRWRCMFCPLNAITITNILLVNKMNIIIIIIIHYINFLIREQKITKKLVIQRHNKPTEVGKKTYTNIFIIFTIYS